MINILDLVALLEDMPQHHLKRGQIGTVVEELAPDVYEVEFSDHEGRTYALVPLKVEQLMRLYDKPVDETL